MPATFYTLVQYTYVFELNGKRHVQMARGVDSRETVKQHLESQHPDLKTVYLEKTKHPGEYQQIVEYLKQDPDWSPITQEQFTASASEANERAAENSPPLPQSIMDALGNPTDAPVDVSLGAVLNPAADNNGLPPIPDAIKLNT